MNQDDSHLDSLAIAHYVVGGFMVLFACFPLLHFAIGLCVVFGVGDMASSLEAQPGGDVGLPPAVFGWLFAVMGLLFFIFGQAISIAVIISGRVRKQRRRYLFSFILACLACAFFPFGTILGVFTILVLSRESVKALYGRT